MARGRTHRAKAAIGWLITLLRDPAVRRGLWALVFFAAAATVFASVSLPREVNLRAGQVAPFTIRSPRDMVDQPTTNELRLAAADRVQPIYQTDQAITAQALEQLDQASGIITKARASWQAALASAAVASQVSSSASSSASSTGGTPAPAPPSLDQAAAALEQALGGKLPVQDYAAVLTADAQSLDEALATARQSLQNVMTQGVTTSQLSAARSQLEAAVLSAPGPGGLVRVMAEATSKALVANRFEDGSATDAARAAAENAVKPAVIARGQVIVREGNVVTPDDVQRLRDAGLLHRGGAFGLWAGATAVALLLLSVCWAFLAQFYPRALGDEVRLVLFGSVVVATLAACRLGLALSPFVAPVPWAAIMATVAFGPGVAVFVGGVAGLGAGLLAHNLTVAVVATIGSWTAVFTLQRVHQRADLLRAGLFAALTEVGSVLLLVGLFLGQDAGVGNPLISRGPLATPLIQDAVAAAVTTLLAGVLAIGTLPYAEALGVLTPFRLLELANPGQPLLRRLLLEAPGTYHHSLMVANLAEAACQAVGGDGLLVRAGSYYHDIGKMKRPGFFVENQQGGANPHDLLPPRLSAQIITSHVEDGVQMARQAHLPEEIIDFIRTHHGSTLVRYFYHVAQKEDGDRTISEEDFRYPGPLPATREAAVVMLADGVEAAVRSLPHPSETDIETCISRLVSDRLQDGQLERAALTLGDLHVIEVTFRRLLVGAYHARITYPEPLGADLPVEPSGPGTAAGA